MIDYLTTDNTRRWQIKHLISHERWSEWHKAIVRQWKMTFDEKKKDSSPDNNMKTWDSALTLLSVIKIK